MTADWGNPQLAELAAYRAPVRGGGIKLDAMENPYSLPAELRPALAQRLAAVDFNRYPDASGSALKAALGQHFAWPDGWQLLLGNGSDELIQLLCLAVARPGAVVMAPEPSFVMYRHLARACGLEFVGVPLREDFSLDGEAFAAAIARHQPALIFLAQPNNPTGNLFAVEEIRAIAAATPGWLVIDEAYVAYAGADACALAASLPRVVLLRTLSKWGLAGLRLGFIAGPAAAVAELEKLRLPYNINVLSEAAALFALEHAEVFEQQIRLLCAERERLAAALAEQPDTRVYPSAANFLLVRQTPARARRVLEALAAADIRIKNLDGSHPALADCLRPSLGTPAENDRLIEVWRQS